MLFYILGSKEKRFTCSAKKALHVSSDFSESLEKYETYIKECRRDNLYLVADFQNNKRGFISSLSNDFDYHMPFFIVCEWHIDNPDNYIRKDNTVILRKGFRHELCNNVTALREFLYCYENQIPAKFTISYQKKHSDKNIYRTFVRELADLEQIFTNTKKYKVKRFEIDESVLSEWEGESLKQHGFYLYNLKEEVG